MLPDIPKLMPLLLAKLTVPVLTLWVPADNAAPPPPAPPVALMMTEPALSPTETLPAPTIVMERASMVPEELCPVVWLEP